MHCIGKTANRCKEVLFIMNYLLFENIFIRITQFRMDMYSNTLADP